MKLVQVEGEVGIARDTNTGSILSVDQQAYENWKAARDKERLLSSTAERVSNLENKLDAIENILAKILEKL